MPFTSTSEIMAGPPADRPSGFTGQISPAWARSGACAARRAFALAAPAFARAAVCSSRALTPAADCRAWPSSTSTQAAFTSRLHRSAKVPSWRGAAGGHRSPRVLGTRSPSSLVLGTRSPSSSRPTLRRRRTTARPPLAPGDRGRRSRLRLQLRRWLAGRWQGSQQDLVLGGHANRGHQAAPTTTVPSGRQSGPQ